MDSQWIKAKAKPDSPAIVFVHGIMSDGGSCWTNKKAKAYWPRLAANEFADFGVYVFSYHSKAFSGRYQVTDAADALWDDLTRQGILQSRIVVFVCHSMGGIVTRRLLVQRQGDLAGPGPVIGLFLVASPSAGSGWANFFYPVINLFRHQQARILKAGEDNQWLTTLGTDFRNLLAKPKPMIRGKELTEERMLYSRFIPWLRPIVSRDEGSRYFPESRSVAGTDHSSIAKPKDANAEQHLLLKQFVEELVRSSYSVTAGLPAGLSFNAALSTLAKIVKHTAQVVGVSSSELSTTIADELQISGHDVAAATRQLIALYFGNAATKFNVAVEDQVITVKATP